MIIRDNTRTLDVLTPDVVALDVLTPNVPKSNVIKPKLGVARSNFKSIIRTRSQKLKEETQDSVNRLFINLNTFYVTHNKEPSIMSTDADERFMATFLMSVRHQISSGEINEKTVQNHLKWFVQVPVHWKDRSFKYEDIMLMSLIFGLLPALMLGAQLYFNYCVGRGNCYATAYNFTNYVGHQLTTGYVLIGQQMNIAYRTVYRLTV